MVRRSRLANPPGWSRKVSSADSRAWLRCCPRRSPGIRVPLSVQTRSNGPVRQRWHPAIPKVWEWEASASPWTVGHPLRVSDVCSIPESGGSWHPLVPEATAASAGGAVRGASQFHHPLSIGLRNNHPPLNNSRRALGNSQTLPAEGKWDPTLKVTLRAVLEFLKRYSVLRR